MPLYDYKCTHCGNESEELRERAHRNDPLFCAVCESRMRLLPPRRVALRTDTQFQQQIHFKDGLRNDKERKYARRLARRMGINIAGKRYNGQFARFPLDPAAFYGDRQEARAACQRAGLASEDLGVAPPPDPPPDERPYKVADDIVEQRVRLVEAQEHGGNRLPAGKRKQLTEDLRDKYSPADGVCG